ncbi:hypothetical protein BDZ85DRAFT_127610 [Elsinoe ampelina]|uniref:BRCT domain-containing protein n=1 Tax=Elsinoe ampelina TaxID=302913 RepID=A0A6A6GAL2_9PEZI|nr:hypothetical protein BDZ85DRAFT_127610 [Elsinoe ampelina]
MGQQRVQTHLDISTDKLIQYNLLRSGDEISFPDQEVSVRFEMDLPRVEVSSSVPVPGGADNRQHLTDGLVPATLLNGEVDDETDVEDGDLDAGTSDLPTLQNTKKVQKHSPESQQHVYSTAQESSAQVVQDTPVAPRTIGVSQMNGQANISGATSPIPAQVESILHQSDITKGENDAADEADIDEPDAPDGSHQPPELEAGFPTGFQKHKSTTARNTYGRSKRKLPAEDAELEPDEDKASPTKKKTKRQKTVELDETPNDTMATGLIKRDSTATHSTDKRSRTKNLKAMSEASDSPSPAAKKAAPKARKGAKATKHPSKDQEAVGIAGRPINVVFSSTKKDSAANQQMLINLGVNIKDDFDDKSETYVCTAPDLKSTSKILSALVQDQPIISDAWVAACRKAQAIVEPTDFQVAEQKDVNTDRSTLFSGRKVVFTQAILTAWGSEGSGNIQRVLKQAGAKVEKKAVTKNATVDEDTLVIGVEDSDLAASALLQKGVNVYKKEFITKSIMEAKLQVDNADMMIGSQEKGGKRKSKG